VGGLQVTAITVAFQFLHTQTNRQTPLKQHPHRQTPLKQHPHRQCTTINTPTTYSL